MEQAYIVYQHILQKAGKALDMLPVYHRANTDWQINTHTPILSCGKFRLPNPPDSESVGCGRKPGYLEETRMNRERESKHRMHYSLKINPKTSSSEVAYQVPPSAMIPTGSIPFWALSMLVLT